MLPAISQRIEESIAQLVREELGHINYEGIRYHAMWQYPAA